MSIRRDTIIIRPEYSAVAAKNPKEPSRAVQAAIEVCREQRMSRICEVGCGLLANTRHFLKAFNQVVLTDRKEQYERIREKLAELETFRSYKGFIEATSFATKSLRLDAAIIMNVLHILPSRRERVELLTAARRNLRSGGILFVDSPRSETYYRGIVKTAIPYGDGFAMRRGDYYTFYKDMSFEKLKEYVEETGFSLNKRIFLDHRATFVAYRA